MLQQFLNLQQVQLLFVGPAVTFILALWLGQPFLKYFKGHSQIIRDDGPQQHLSKQGIPTMGGIFLIASLFTGVLLFSPTWSWEVLSLLCLPLIFAVIGFSDDVMKLRKNSVYGLAGVHRLILEFIISYAFILFLCQKDLLSSMVYLPFFDGIRGQGFYLHPILYSFLGSFVVVGSANAVNLTDGLDGLASYLMLAALSAFIVIGFFTVDLFYGDSVAFVGLLCCASILGFLWYNVHPARVFLGDTGSLFLGAFLGTMAILLKVEFLLPIVGFLFVLEALSVMIQVFSFKKFGKRVFKMAPLHHHFEQLGHSETEIVGKFWILSIWLAIVTCFIYFY